MIYVLGLLAKAGHGKTTVARHLGEAFGAETRSLAGPLKRAVQKVFGFSEAQLWGTQADKEAIDARYGFSHNTNHTVLLFFSWASGDVIPPGIDQHSLSFQTLTSMLPGGN